MKYYEPLQADHIYHIFSRAVGSEKIFTCWENYLLFLHRFEKFISPIADVYAYCLLPNHFHFLIRIKPPLLLEEKFKTLKPGRKITDGWQPKFVMQQFSNLLNSYAKKFNLLYDRKGALFIDYLRRVEIETEDQFISTVFYIHKNPVHHGYCKEMTNWESSSYKNILTNSAGLLPLAGILNWFGSIDNFMEIHAQPVYLKKKFPDKIEFPNL